MEEQPGTTATQLSDDQRSLPINGRRGRYLTVGVNNALTLGLGVAVVAFAAFALTTSVLSDRAAFAGMVLLGAFY